MNYNHHLRENTDKVKCIKIITFFMTKSTKENIYNKKETIQKSYHRALLSKIMNAYKLANINRKMIKRYEQVREKEIKTALMIKAN